ncbi:SLC13 family permease [Hominifimenecus sp. rT4P-3]|uniref:SLC13 family permease n=1 Tax=Hominifimenecus sp. rT4P-3 TaxID=3242979 RepID=UPI003DA2DABB
MEQSYIVLIILAVMILGFLINKWSYGLTTMICCALLALTGVLPIQDAFAGFCNKTLIMIACIFVISHAFGKTSFLHSIQMKIMKMQGGKSALAILLIFCALIAFFAQMMVATTTVALMIMLLGILSSDKDLCASRVLLPTALLASIWTSKVPVAMGATASSRLNAFLEAYGVTFGLTDVFKASIITLILLSVYFIFGYKMLPKNEIDASQIGSVKEFVAIPRGQEIITYIVFVCVMGSFFFGKALGDYMYMMPVIGVIVLQITKTLTMKEVLQNLSTDMVFMLAGIFVLSDALVSSGAGELLGNAINGILGKNPSSVAIVTVFTLGSGIMTNFMNNTATYNVLVPLAAAASVAGGFDPRAAVMGAAMASYFTILPYGATNVAMAFAAGHYTLKNTLKFTLPFFLIAEVSTILCVLWLFPC